MLETLTLDDAKKLTTAYLNEINSDVVILTKLGCGKVEISDKMIHQIYENVLISTSLNLNELTEEECFIKFLKMQLWDKTATKITM